MNSNGKQQSIGMVSMSNIRTGCPDNAVLKDDDDMISLGSDFLRTDIGSSQSFQS